MNIQNALVSIILDRSQQDFAHVTTVTLSWRVQNIVVIGRVYFTLECFEFSSNFEFDRNMLNGTGAWCVYCWIIYPWLTQVRPPAWANTLKKPIWLQVHGHLQIHFLLWKLIGVFWYMQFVLNNPIDNKPIIIQIIAWLAPNRRWSRIWSNDGLFYWRMPDTSRLQWNGYNLQTAFKKNISEWIWLDFDQSVFLRP